MTGHRAAPGDESPPTGGERHDADPRVARSRSKMLAAATELLVEAGPRAVTVDAVAERSGVAKSTLYRHWDSRTDLLVDVMRANMPEFTPPDLGAGFEASLRALMRELALALSSPEWGRIMPALISLQLHMPELADLDSADREAKIAVLASILDLGAAEGLLPAGLDPHRAVQVLIGPMVFATITGDDDQVLDLAEHVVDRFIASYRTVPTPEGHR